VIGIRDDDKRCTAQPFEMRAIMFTHWQWINEDVATGSDPRHAPEIDVAALVEARPGEEIGTVQEFQEDSPSSWLAGHVRRI
jgi:hypothetical protein